MKGRRDGFQVNLKAMIELFWFNEIEDVRKSLSSRYSVWKLDPFLKPGGLVFAKIFNFSEVIHPAKSGGNSHEKDFSKMVFTMIPSARIFDDLKSFKSVWESESIINFIWISGHSSA